MLDQARRHLTETRAEQVAAHSASLITALDEADAGTRPIGIGRASVLLVGMIGGLIFGLGLTFLTVTPTIPVVSNSPATTNSQATPKKSVKFPESVKYTPYQSQLSSSIGEPAVAH